MNPDLTPAYIGRFAPSPTGPLHFGSLLAATASYLDARANQGHWRVRIEDLDKPREQPGAADAILQTLEDFGLQWDGEVVYQSQRDDLYVWALNALRADNKAYPCACSRKEIARIAHTGPQGMIYPGTCRHGLPAGKSGRAWRLKIEPYPVAFEDAIQGLFSLNLANDIGDFVIKRADGLFAYQLAVVVDDAEQQISHVVRGADLLPLTPAQIFLQQQLGLPTPTYAHIAVATANDGQKLSKQTHARPVDANRPTETLLEALRFLGLKPPADLASSQLDDIWHWAIQRWDTRLLPKQRELPAPASVG